VGISVQLWSARKVALVVLRMNAIHRASIHACSVFDADAGLGDRIGHRFPHSRYRIDNCPDEDTRGERVPILGSHHIISLGRDVCHKALSVIAAERILRRW